MKKVLRSIAILAGIAAVCFLYSPLISVAQDTDRPIQELLLDVNIGFKEKLDRLSKEENLFDSLEAMDSEGVMKAYLCSLDVGECYQHTIFIQHQFLWMLQKDLAEGVGEKGKLKRKEAVDFALRQMKENQEALKAKFAIVSLDDEAKERLESALFEMVYAEPCKGLKASADPEEKGVADLAALRGHLTTLAGIDMDEIYEELGCYRGMEEIAGTDKEDTGAGEEAEAAKKEEIIKNHIYSLYGFGEGALTEQDKGGPKEADGSENKEGNKEGNKEDEVGKGEPSDLAEAGGGVLKLVTSRTADVSTAESDEKGEYRSMPGEGQYYEVYAKTEEDMADRMEIVVSIGEERQTHEAVKGEFKVMDSAYNWRLQVPYEELLLEESDGQIRADIRALNEESKVVGRAQASPMTASGVYDINKRWIGSDFAKLNTNKNADQVYYVHGTVYSDDCNAHHITKSTNGTGKYSHLSVSSLDGGRATVRVRASGKAITGTWLMIYGRIELNNLNIIGCGGSDRTVGLVSAKNSKQTSSETKQSYLSANNCSFSVANKWAVHGDRNSYLEVNDCTISKTKGGVGSHGEINVRNTTLNGAGSPYTGWAGIHLNVPVSQGGFRHSINLENDRVDGYLTGVEFAVSDFFSDQPVGDELTSLSLTLTGGGNTLRNCTTGIQTSKNNVDIPLTLDVKGTMSDINSCTTGIHVGYDRDTVGISAGGIHGGNAGVRNRGTFLMDGGNIYSNTTGLINTGAVTMTNGAIHSNSNGGNGGGIFNDSGAKLTMTGGSVTENAAKHGGGIFNQSNSSLNITGGLVSGNTGTASGGGIYNENAAVTQITGGEIEGNGGASGTGIYQNGTLRLEGDAYINGNNEIYLPAGKFVSVSGILSSTQAVAALLPADCTLGRTCARADYGGAKGSAIYEKFTLKANPPYLLRPADYQSGSGKADTDVVVSRGYTISYHKNYAAEVANVPASHMKYWYESARVSSQTPSLAAITFKGWSEDPKAQDAAYRPGDTIASGANGDMMLHAVWEAKVKVTYVGNHAEDGTEKSECVTKQECDHANGYQVKKNSEYTKYKRPGYTFAGWAISESANEAKDVNYPEKSVNRLSFEELRKLAITQGGNHAHPQIPEVILYDVWDAIPEMTADGVQEFYEGTEVTKEMLLANIKATDKEDGDLTKNIHITKVVYAKGKLIDGIKADSQSHTWDNDMPGDYQLDTWFHAMDKEDSPVTHLITYAVADAFGNTTECEWAVKVKYNEFPIIETEDRYFTLEEAQKGVISEEVLIKEALDSGKLKVTDQEDDELYPGTIPQRVVLLDFHPDELKQFQESGYVALTYSVKDSMGPKGEGKETTCQFNVHVVKDGEITEPRSAKCVRFINKEYYELNADSSDKTLSEEEKKALNANGGLNVDSKWYKEEEYKNLIHSLWTDAEPDEIWKFSHQDVEKVKDYINEHGIGNSVQSDGLSGFVNEFGSLRTAQ